MTAQEATARPRTVLASFSTYAQATGAVGDLAARKFPVENIDIVGSDLQVVEHVTGRLTGGRAMLGGALSGAWFGLFIGLVFWIVTPWTAAPFVSAILIGLGFGALFGLCANSLTKGRRDFTSLRSMEAKRYDVLIPQELADEARWLLAAGPAASQRVAKSRP